MGKKGEMTVTTLVTLILLVLGFLIVLFLYYQLNWTGNVDTETCHQSVVFRGTMPALMGAQSYVPLKCKTKKVCITAGLLGGKCDDFKNENGVTTVRVSSKDQIEKFIAKDVVECWSMMGEGKVSLFSQWVAKEYGFGPVYPSCVICSRIAFDNTALLKKGIRIEDIDVTKYMMTHAIPGETNLSYYNYLTGGGAKINLGDMVTSNVDQVQISEGQNAEDFPSSNDFAVGDLGDPKTLNNKPDEMAITFMQISGPSAGNVLQNDLKLAMSFLGFGMAYKPGSFFTTATTTSTYKNPIIRDTLGRFAKGSGKIITKTSTKIATTTLTKVIVVAAIVTLGVQQVNVAANRAVTAGYCGDVSTGSESRDGCSVVRTTNYNATEIAQYCSIIESIP
jgi:hypothetical protein